MMRRKIVGPLAPSEAAASSTSRSSSSQHRLHGADDEGKRHKAKRQHDRRLGEGEVDPDRAGVAVERNQDEAGDDRRQRERQVDHGIHQ